MRRARILAGDRAFSVCVLPGEIEPIWTDLVIPFIRFNPEFITSHRKPEESKKWVMLQDLVYVPTAKLLIAALWEG